LDTHTTTQRNGHSPERFPGESQQDYRFRQRASRELAKAMRRGPRQAPAINALDVSRFWLGQHKASEARRERRAAIKSVGRRQYLKVTKAADVMRALAAELA
jgi:hypothetical protein